MNDLDAYTHIAIDIDYSKYRVINADVCMYNGQETRINAILSKFSERIDKISNLQLFIKGNRLFFTYGGIKYYTIVSCWFGEWELIQELIQELSKIADNVAYLKGELD